MEKDKKPSNDGKNINLGRQIATPKNSLKPKPPKSKK